MTKNESKPKLTFMHFIAAAALLSIIEPALILAGVLSPILSYSPGNLVFSILKLVVITYYGIHFSKLGIKRCAINGAILGFVTSCIIVLFASLGKSIGKAVLGLTMAQGSYAAMMAIIILENALLGAIVAAISCWIAGRAACTK